MPGAGDDRRKILQLNSGRRFDHTLSVLSRSTLSMPNASCRRRRIARSADRRLSSPWAPLGGAGSLERVCPTWRQCPGLTPRVLALQGVEARVQLDGSALGSPLGVARSSEQGCRSQCPQAVGLGKSLELQGPGQSLRTARSSEQGCKRQCPRAVGLGRRHTCWRCTVGCPYSGASRKARRPFLCGRSERT